MNALSAGRHHAQGRPSRQIDRAVEVCRRLDEKYGPVECFLDHASPFRLTIAVLLSAQTTTLRSTR